MAEWHLKAHELKRYPHFDPPISADSAVEYATDKSKVSRHSFYPFIRFTQAWTKFAPRGKQGKSKKRELRYAARRDAYIFSYYRHILSESYERTLKELGLHSSVLGYRRIPDEHGKGGKCNIHFARDAFAKINEMGNCCAIALDVSDFFESLDHEKLKALWCRMLGVGRLPADHFAVFKAITQYAVADKEKVYERLGHYGPKRRSRSGKTISGYLTPFDKIPIQLCRGREFRDKIAGGGPKSVIERHYKPYGIPQGAPISDLLANLYMLDFDVAVAGIAARHGGSYYRYSDDIMLIIPCGKVDSIAVASKVRALIQKFGDKLVIKEDKSSIVAYAVDGDRQRCELVAGDGSCSQGIEYLGFRYSGAFAYIRNKTIQNLYRKITRAARRESCALARRYPNRTAAELKSAFNRQAFVKRFHKVENFREKEDDYRSWTFWTYAHRAAEVFGPTGAPITRQLRRLRQIVLHKIDHEIERAVQRRDGGKWTKRIPLGGRIDG